MKRDCLDYLEDILTAIDETADFTKGISFEAFKSDRKTFNAVVRSLEVIGEAAKCIPEDFQAEAPDIPWKYMARMRDKLIHHYFGVDPEIVWSVIQSELPPLKPKMEALYRRSFPEE